MLVAFAADGGNLLAVTPAPAALRADPEAADERTWLLVAAAVGALAELAPGTLLAGELGGSLVLAMPGTVTAEDAELAALAFEEQVAGVDRLRATALALPGHVVEGSVAELREPIGATHPLRVAAAVARLGGRPADPASSDEHEEAVLAMLTGERRPGRRAPARRPRSGAPRARRVLQRLDGMGKWGGYHTEFAHLARGFRGNDRALAESVGESLLQAGLLVEKPSRRPAPRLPELAARRGHPQAHRRRRRAIRPSSPVISRPVALSRLGTKLFTVRTLARAGIAKPARPDRLVRAVQALRAWGKTPAAGYGVSAARYPNEPAIIDEQGTITFAELDSRTNAIARRWKADGIGPGSSIAILCRNHRGFVESTLAASKTGADMLYLNTSFAGPQIAEVCREERPVAMVHDEEFGELVAEALAGMHRYVADDIPRRARTAAR